MGREKKEYLPRLQHVVHMGEKEMEGVIGKLGSMSPPESLKDILSIDSVPRCGRKDMDGRPRLRCVLWQVTLNERAFDDMKRRCAGCSNLINDYEREWFEKTFQKEGKDEVRRSS